MSLLLALFAFLVFCVSYAKSEEPTREMHECFKNPPTFSNVASGLSEDTRIQRQEEYYGEWPIKPAGASEGLMEFYAKREEWIMRTTEPGSQKRWEYWLDFMQMQIHPTFTENGFSLRDIPTALHQKLSRYFHERYPRNAQVEHDVPYFIEGARNMAFLDSQMQTEVISGVQPIHEEWAGNIPLEYTALYGIRAYEAGSKLFMHVDRASTHVISAILHIARDYGNQTETWPIEIIGLDGKHHKVELKEGQMLLYESSKCYHGRPSEFEGKYYASAFVHFKPKDWAYVNEHRVAAVPRHFNFPYSRWVTDIQPKLPQLRSKVEL